VPWRLQSQKVMCEDEEGDGVMKPQLQKKTITPF